MNGGHPLVSRLYDPVMALPERLFLKSHREYLAADLDGRILDLGSGTGAMYPYFKDSGATEVHAIEPDPHMRERARRRATRSSLDVQITDARAERLPFADDSFDAVIASLVFCTIPEPAGALDEIARVLRSGGEFRFLEHVRATGSIGRLHDFLTPAWHTVAGGCHLNRETGRLFQTDERFRLVDFRRFQSRFTPMIRGKLRRNRKSSRIRSVLAGDSGVFDD